MQPHEQGEETANRAIFGIAPAVLLAGVAGGIAFPILPIVGAQAGLKLPFIGVILAANRAARVVSNPIVGGLADRLGGRRMLIAGTLIQIVVMSMYALGVRTGHPGAFFFFGRLIHGPGSACIFVSAQMLALRAGGRSHGGRAASAIRAAMAIGVPVGLTAGGMLSDVWGPERTFEAAILAVAAAGVAAYALVPDLRAPVRRSARLIDTVRAMSDRRLAVVGVLNFAASFSAQGMVLTTMALLVSQRHISLGRFSAQGTSGALMAWMIIVEAGSMQIFGRLGDRRKAHARIATLGLAVLVVSLVVTGLASSTAMLCLGLALIGIGGGGLGPSLLALVGQLSSADRYGTAVGVLQLCGDVGAALGPLVGTALFAGAAHTPYLVSAALLASALPFAFWLQARMAADRRDSSEGAPQVP